MNLIDIGILPNMQDNPRSSISLPAPAKINLALSVAAAGPDGYHPIASWMLALNFTDKITLTKKQTTGSRFTIRFADDAPAPQPIDWPLEKDLAYRAHQLLEREVGRDLPVDATIEKRIPAGMGLGGGSADAAAMLVGLNELFALHLPESLLMPLAATLGCDVGFSLGALRGHRSALATGLGETLQPLPLNTALHLALILPNFTCPTGAVYKQFDALGSGSSQPDEPSVRALTQSALLADDALFNDLAAPAMAVQPRLRDAVAQVRQATGRRVHVTGSGAGMFVLCQTSDDAQATAQHIQQTTHSTAIATQTFTDDQAGGTTDAHR